MRPMFTGDASELAKTVEDATAERIAAWLESEAERWAGAGSGGDVRIGIFGGLAAAIRRGEWRK